MRTYTGDRTPDGLAVRIEESEDPRSQDEASLSDLPHVPAQSADGFEWGYLGSGPADLARAVLTDHLGGAPAQEVVTAFCADVIASLPRPSFRLPESDVHEWLQAYGWDQVDQAGAEVEGPGPQRSDPAGSRVVAACEEAWREIQSHHTDLPDVVIVLGSGVERGRLVKLGHWWGGQWTADGEARAEVLLAGEALHLPPKDVFEVLLHEAAHGLNAARGLKDTSRGGRYHNAVFARTAKEVMLRVKPMPPYGMAETSLSPAAVERYQSAIDRLGDAMRIARKIRGVRLVAETGQDAENGRDSGPGREGGSPTGGTGGRSSGQSVTTACGCGRRIRMAPSTLAAGPIVCGLCNEAFAQVPQRRPQQGARPDVASDPALTLDAPARPGVPSAAVVDESFIARRQAAIAAEVRDGGERTPEAGLPDARADEHPGRKFDPSSTGRRQRLNHLLGEGIAAAVARQQSTVLRLEDRLALAEWYQRFDTFREEPMPAGSPTEADRRVAAARSLLKAEGVLRGPEALSADGLPFQAGDRVVPVKDMPKVDLPAGTPGRVESVDDASRTMEIDFAAWGRLRANLDGRLARVFRHDYVEAPEPSPPDRGLER